MHHLADAPPVQAPKVGLAVRAAANAATHPTAALRPSRCITVGLATASDTAGVAIIGRQMQVMPPSALLSCLAGRCTPVVSRWASGGLALWSAVVSGQFRRAHVARHCEFQR